MDTTEPRPARRKHSFRTWRRTRPFWGGVISILAGLELYGTTATPNNVLAMQDLAPASAIGSSLLIVLLSIATWRKPSRRLLSGPVVIILSLVSLLLVNLGGFLVGTLLGVIGGSLLLAWTPRPLASDDVPTTQTLPVADADQAAGATRGGSGADRTPALTAAIPLAEAAGGSRTGDRPVG
jgi:hypothetical protein